MVRYKKSGRDLPPPMSSNDVNYSLFRLDIGSTATQPLDFETVCMESLAPT